MRAACIRSPKRVVLADAQNYRVLKAAEIVLNEKLATPILLGNEEVIKGIIADFELELEGVEIIDNKSDSQKNRRRDFAKVLHKKQKRNGINQIAAQDMMLHRHYFGPMLVESGYADSVLLGITRNYPDSISSALHVIGKRDNISTPSAMYHASGQNEAATVLTSVSRMKVRSSLVIKSWMPVALATDSTTSTNSIYRNVPTARRA